MADSRLISRRAAAQVLLAGGAGVAAAPLLTASAAEQGAPVRRPAAASSPAAASHPACVTSATDFGTNGHYQDGLPRSSPEAQGVASEAIAGFLDEARTSGLELNSFMLFRHGHVIAEGWWWPYRPELVHMMHSLTKSVTTCAVGLALKAGKFKLTDKVVSFFPEQLPAQVSANLAAMTVEDLLTMRTGHDHQTSGSQWRPIKTSWVAEFYKIPVVHEPGSVWVYTSAATYMLSAIFTKTMGQPVYEFLKPRLLGPMGIRSENWAPGPEDITPGANGLNWHTADSLKLGILHLQGGRWQGQQLLPEDWAQAVHQPHVPGKYGYQWWLGPQDAYYADGLFGQLSFVFPHHDAVLAVTGATPCQDLVWKHFPKAFEAAALAAGKARSTALSDRLKQLRVLPPLVATSSARAPQISGRTFHCAANEDEVSSIRLDFSPDRCVFNLFDSRGEHAVTCGLQDWIEGFTTMTGDKLHHEYQPELMRVVAGGLWKSADTFEMTWQFSESAFRDTVTCTFSDESVSLARRVNVNSASLERPVVRATMARL